MPLGVQYACFPIKKGAPVASLGCVDYSDCVLLYVGKNCRKSFNVQLVPCNILAMLLVDGQRGWPYCEKRLLLLNVVGSNPQCFARPEQLILCAVAKQSIAFQTSACVIFVLLCYACCCYYKI